MPENPIPLEIEPSKDLPDQEAEKKKKRQDFWLGLIGSVVLSLAFLFLGATVSVQLTPVFPFLGSPELTGIGLTLLIFILNLVAIIFTLVKRRPMITVGILSAIGLFFVCSAIIVFIPIFLMFGTAIFGR